MCENKLYHLMNITKAMDVFNNNSMPAKWEHTIPMLGKRLGNSFSRNKHFTYGNDAKIVKITINKDKLKTTNKILPLDAEYVFSYGCENPRYYNYQDRRMNPVHHCNLFAEEFVLKDIKNINKVITRIDLYVKTFVRYDLTRDLIKTIEHYAGKYGIEFKVHNAELLLPDYEEMEMC